MHEFILTDDQGGEHRYTLTLLPASKALPLGRVLYAKGLGPLAKLLTEKGIDKERLGAELLALIPQLIELLDLSFLQQLFVGVQRDGLEVTTQTGFDRAFTANYGELVALVVEVVKANGFFPFSRLGSFSTSGLTRRQG